LNDWFNPYQIPHLHWPPSKKSKLRFPKREKKQEFFFQKIAFPDLARIAVLHLDASAWNAYSPSAE